MHIANKGTLEIFKEMVKTGIMPNTQVKQSKVFGVRESTINGWINQNRFPVYARKLLLTMLELNELQQFVQDVTPILSSAIPVEYNDKVLVVQLDTRHSAVYNNDLVGDVVCECDCADNATRIIDAIATDLAQN